jgi:hypothetical protein
MPLCRRGGRLTFSCSNSLRCTSLRQLLAVIRLPLRCSARPYGGGDGVGFGFGFGFGWWGGEEPEFAAPSVCCAAKSRADSQIRLHAAS